MQRSESIKELATALAKAQAEMTSASYDRENPHFKSRYATLASVMTALKPANAHGLSIVQAASVSRGECGVVVSIETVLMHCTGEFLSESLALRPGADTPQAIGSAITYGRRYSAASIVGLAADEDDDANAATNGRGNSKPAAQQQQRPPAVTNQAPKLEKAEADRLAAEKAGTAKPMIYHVCRSCSAIQATADELKACRHCASKEPLIRYRTIEKAQTWKKDFPAPAGTNPTAAAPSEPPQAQPVEPASHTEDTSANGKIKAAELTELFGLFAKIKATSAEMLATSSQVCGRQIKSSGDLTMGDRHMVRDYLKNLIAAADAIDAENDPQEVAA